MELKFFDIKNCPAWSYTTLTHRGTCVVDGQQIKMRFTVSMTSPQRVPDVLGIEAFCKGMSAEKDTLEGYTAKLATFLGLTVTGKGKTATHGLITCTVAG